MEYIGLRLLVGTNCLRKEAAGCICVSVCVCVPERERQCEMTASFFPPCSLVINQNGGCAWEEFTFSKLKNPLPEGC